MLVRIVTGFSALLAVVALTACGGGNKAASTTTAATTAPATTTAATTTRSSGGAATTTSPQGPGALQGEAAQTAAGDIPDNQQFVTYTGTRFSMKVPEGWARTGGGGTVTFRDKNNIVRVVIQQGSPPTVASVTQELAKLAGAHVQRPPAATKIGGLPAVSAVYSTVSAPNPVTGKRMTLIVDRYELGRNGTRAVVDLAAPQGVDNVDAYRLMTQSFRLK